ncbi:MAG: tetratricopeptide repeat protein [Saprospiraceae bacterium]|nr:tetratricopeptide repeat protein [Saprospiraceae bacterium]
MAKKNTNPSKSATRTPDTDPGVGFDWQTWIPIILAFVVFSTGLRNEILGIDDHTATVDNPAVVGFSPFTHFNLGMYAPITWLFYGIAYALGKDNAVLYHLLSLGAHVFNVYLVGKLILRISGQRGTAFWVALLFAIHPIQVESVAWIAGFSTPLYALFFLLSCNWYLDYAEKPEEKRAYSLALTAFVLACLSKSAAVTLPLVLVLLDWWTGRPVLDRKRIMGYAPFFAIALFFGALTVYSRMAAGMNMDANGNNYSLLDRFLVLCYTPVLYWGKYLLPLKLNIYYGFEKVNGQFPWTYWVAPAVLAAVLYFAWRWRNSARYLVFGILFFFANISVMLPFRSMGTFELCADHYNYLAMIGIFFALAQGLPALAERWPGASGLLRAAVGVWTAAMIFYAVRQITIWKDTFTVVNHAIENGSHQNGRLYEARANALAKNKDLNGAIKDYTKALEINPELWESYKYRGSLYGAKRQYEKSVQDLGKYIEQYPDQYEQVFNLGLSLYNMGHLPEAVKAFDRTLQIDPNFERAYAARGNAYMAMGDSAKAELDLREYEKRKQ